MGEGRSLDKWNYIVCYSADILIALAGCDIVLTRRESEKKEESKLNKKERNRERK